MIPSFATFNAVAGMFVTGLFVLGVWYTNTWNTGFLPINTNRVYDHFGKLYNVSRTLDDRGMFDLNKYMGYSAPYMGAANALLYGFFFAIYTAILTHVVLYQRYEVTMGFRNLFRSLRIRKNKATSENSNSQTTEGEYSDVHNRLMAAYPEGKFALPTLLLFPETTKLASNIFIQCLSGGTSAFLSYQLFLVSSA